MLNKFTKIILSIAAAMMASISCEKAPVAEPEYLDVTVNHISGEWKLFSRNGNEILEGTSLYIEFIRNDRTFICKNGMEGQPAAPKEYTGKFNIYHVDGTGTVIEGLNDHDTGFWNDKYIISELTADAMKFTGLDTGEVMVFHRISNQE